MEALETAALEYADTTNLLSTFLGFLKNQHPDIKFTRKFMDFEAYGWCNNYSSKKWSLSSYCVQKTHT